ncbi:Protein AF-9-like [Oopsacas minuta]|uniref:Protein AF-9-like n=1 Tax=Oopsacas minuta TaxID=111878 RepID=A0AAV7KAV2_9METZ|nr:Protein AF-9-like [Oopsacas minuta]
MAVQVKLVLGHTANWRKKPTPDGFTHDWTVLVRGEDNAEIKHFVEKVVFHLHESFSKSKRGVKDPPYQVKESGYGSFNMRIEVFFRNKDDLKSQLFEYDLLLPNAQDPPINQLRSETLTFQTPNEEFKSRLIKGGGILLSETKPKPEKEKRTDKIEEKPIKRAKLDNVEKPHKKRTSQLDEVEKMDVTNNWDTTTLKNLHRQLNNIADTNKLQQIVNVVESTGHYTLTKTTFDFDLCKLDPSCLNKLFGLVEDN